MQREEFIQRVNRRCEAFLEERTDHIRTIAEQGLPLVESLVHLTRGGKKLRPVLAWIGWRGAGGNSGPDPAVELLGSALELFQAAALVHDDVIDRSATRRGQPSTHVRFEELHRTARYSGEAHHFGVSGAILSGDLALSWAGEAFAQAQALSPEPPHGRAGSTARTIFQKMHTEVITGQYLDVLAEVQKPAETEAEAIGRARNVLRYKAAKYSSEYPVLLGCALAGGSPELLETFAQASLPVGEAFQLRDDLLGVFGDPESTGKPVGDDLREGKRTELIAYGLFRSAPEQAQELETMLGNPHLDDQQVTRAREILISSGAVAAVEAEISELRARSESARLQLAEQGVSEEVLEDFAAVADLLVSRSF